MQTGTTQKQDKNKRKIQFKLINATATQDKRKLHINTKVIKTK